MPPITYRVDKTRAFRMVEEIVAIGPRPSGSQNAAKMVLYITEKCKEFGYEPTVDSWPEITPTGTIEFRNVYARIGEETGRFILLGSHYDTKNIGGSTFVGANDSGSSTALLLEIMQTLKSAGPWRGYPIRFAFFDGEEAQRQYADNDGLHGSKRLAKTLQAASEHKQCAAMILLDMIGDRDLTVTLSRNDDPDLIRRLLALAEKTNVRQQFEFFRAGTILDDHIPFKELGIPVIDIIDLQYGPNNSYWHSHQDTIDKISPDSLEIIGTIVIQLIQELSHERI